MSSTLAPILIVILMPIFQEDKPEVVEYKTTTELSVGTSQSIDITLDDIEDIEEYIKTIDVPLGD
jgi:hypothetical protein